MGRPALKKAFRRGHDIHIPLTERERDDLEFEVNRHQVGLSTYIRTLITLARRGVIVVPPSAFDRQL